MRFVLVLGKLPAKQYLDENTISPQFKRALDFAVDLVAEDKADRIIISGGVTTAGYPSEAEMARSYLPAAFETDLILEKRSKTTRENIQMTRALLEAMQLKVDSLILITSKTHARRAKLHMDREWKEVSKVTRYRSVPEKSLRDTLTHHVYWWAEYLRLAPLAYWILKKFHWRNS